jgi:hypothetical protein
MGRTSQAVPLAAATDAREYRRPGAADTDNCTKLRWLHRHRPEHVS